MKVLVCGSRDWEWESPIIRELSKFPKNTVVVHGCAKGVDTFAGSAARRFGFKVLEYPANWKKYGKSAGMIRNKKMLEENPDIKIVLAFSEDLSKSKGTANMIKTASERGIEVRYFSC
jgi:hypothetical protein